MVRMLLVIVAWAWLCSACQAFDGVPILEPTHRLSLSTIGLADSYAVGPDGSCVYVARLERAINLTRLALEVWAAVAPWVAGAVSLLLLVALWRVGRSPQIPGETHCRRCNYCLRGQAGQRCPECGAPSTRVTLGRSGWARLRNVTLASILLLGLAGLVRVPGAVRWVSAQFPWWSFRLEKEAAYRGYDLARFVSFVTRLQRIDTASGGVKREALFADMVLPTLHPAPDGARLLVLGPRPCVLDARTLQRLRNLPEPPGGKRGRWGNLVGFDRRGDPLLTTTASRLGTIQVRSLDLETGSAAPVLEFDAASPTEVALHTWPRMSIARLISAQFDSRPVIIEVPPRRPDAPHWAVTARLRIWAADGSNELIRELTMELPGLNWPPFAIHKDRFVTAVGGELRRIDSQGHIEERRRFEETLGVGLPYLGSSYPEGQLICSVTIPGQFHGAGGWTGRTGLGLLDLESGEWRAVLIRSAEDRAARFEAAGDGRVIVVRSTTSAKPNRYELLIYDLRTAVTPDRFRD